jgi:drug/metabolite transporter (DMT)-like permease
MINELLLVLSEVILSAYPLLIKLVDVSVILQTGLRMGVFATLAAVAAVLTKSPLSIGSLLSMETLGAGVLNLIHVFTSYTAFEQLTGGNAMALFYTYPVFNIFGTAAVFNEKIPLTSVPWIALALGGAIALAQPTSTNWTLVGVISALVAALTEVGIYIWFRLKNEKESNQPWTKMIQMYGSSGVLWAVGIAVAALAGVLAKNTLNLTSNGLGGILAFNSFIGFTGYALRFFLIPQVSTIVFSVLSFFGIVSAYVFDWIFTNQKPNMTQILGAVAIMVANAMLITRDIA